MTAQEKAETIAAQLGGVGRLQAFVGAHDFVHDAKGSLTFKFRGSRRANAVTVEIEPTDTYKVTFWRWNRRSLKWKRVAEFTDIYAEQLPEVFETFTGLCLSF